MKLAVLLVVAALLGAYPLISWRAEAQTETPAGALGNILNMCPMQLPPFIIELLTYLVSGGLNAILAGISTVASQCLLSLRTICSQNPEFQQSLVNDVILCAALGLIAGLCVPIPLLTSVCSSPILALFGAVFGVPTGLCDGWLRWTGYYSPAPSDIAAAEAQEKLNQTKQPQYIVVPVQ